MIPFIKAKWFTAVPKSAPRRADLIVLHIMEDPDKGDTAEAVARYFAGGSGGRKASAHYCVDNDSIVQCVRDEDVAYGAPGANHNGLHIEQAGFASQSIETWNTPYNTAMLSRSAHLAAQKCKELGIPAIFLPASALKAGKRGITTHAECTHAFGGTHTDPGPNFPLGHYIIAVQEALKAL